MSKTCIFGSATTSCICTGMSRHVLKLCNIWLITRTQPDKSTIEKFIKSNCCREIFQLQKFRHPYWSFTWIYIWEYKALMKGWFNSWMLIIIRPLYDLFITISSSMLSLFCKTKHGFSKPSYGTPFLICMNFSNW